jgi:hypothetical protein
LAFDQELARFAVANGELAIHELNLGGSCSPAYVRNAFWMRTSISFTHFFGCPF